MQAWRRIETRTAEHAALTNGRRNKHRRGVIHALNRLRANGNRPDVPLKDGQPTLMKNGVGQTSGAPQNRAIGGRDEYEKENWCLNNTTNLLILNMTNVNSDIVKLLSHLHWRRENAAKPVQNQNKHFNNLLWRGSIEG